MVGYGAAAGTPQPDDWSRAACSPPLLVHRSDALDQHRVHLFGELDIATRWLVSGLGDDRRRADVVLDLRGLAFMDCCGYGAIVGLTNALAAQGRSLVLENHMGGPARLLELVGHSFDAPMS